MAITQEFDNAEALAALKQVQAKAGDSAPLLRDIGEYLMLTHNQRFKAQQSPEGTPWAPLSPRYQKRKKKNADRILFLDGYLANTLRYQVGNNELQFGSDRPYAALMHFGGQVKRKARTQDLFFKQNRDGSVGNKFVKKKKSNFAQTANVGEHTANYPARPWLGTSKDDDSEILAITQRYLLSLD